METIQPILKRGRDVWDRINMPEAEFRERAQRIQEKIRKENLDVMLVYGAGLNEYGNSCYLSNFVTKMPQGALVILPKEGEVTFIFQGGSRELKTVQTTTWIEDTRPAMDLPQACVKFLKEKGLVPSRVGIAGIREWMPVREYQVLMDGIAPCEVIDMDHVLREMRMVKSPKECDQMRRASRIVARGFDFISGAAFPDTNERMIEAMIDREMRLEGVEDVRILIGKPREKQWALRPADDLPVSEGDSVIIYLALSFERYWAEGIRTFSFKDSFFEKPDLGTFAGIFEKGLSGMGPGRTVSQFYKGLLGDADKSGLEPILDYGLGHGIGLGPNEFPVIDDKSPIEMKEGMCFVLRLAAKSKKFGAVMTGDTFLLTQNGPEKLTV